MRILKIHNYYTEPGGEDTVFHAETKLLRSRGHEVIQFVERNKKIEGMNKAFVALETIWSHSSNWRLRRFLADHMPDVAHFHNTFPLISPAAYYVCKEQNLPVVQTLDNQRLICPASKFHRGGKLCLECLGKTPPWPGVIHACYHNSRLHTAVVASMLTFHRWLGTWQRMVDVFLCSTNFYRDLFIRSGLPSEKIVVMPHFVKTHPISNNRGKRKDYAVFIGRLDPEKGVETLLNAWRFLSFPLKIRGSGLLNQKARDFVKRHKMENVELIDRLDEQGLSDLLEGARFLVMPSEGFYETFGMVIVEAYSRGVPVVASNIGVVPELVSNGRTGLLFESGNPRDLAEKAAWMWEHPFEADEMGRNGFVEFEKRFNENRCYTTLMEVYERLINSR